MQTTINELSDSERCILLTITLYALKKYLAPDFPIFAIDGLGQLLDDDRFRAFIGYLAKTMLAEGEVLIVTRAVSGPPTILSQKHIHTTTVSSL